MERQILLSMTVIGIAAGALGAGTFAFFSDPATSEANIFTAATVDLALGNFAYTTAMITNGNLLPGDEVTGSVTLTNAGSALSGLDLDIAFDLATTNLGGSGTTTLTEFLQVTELKYGSRNLLAEGECYGAADSASNGGNANGRIDLADLNSQACLDLDTPAATGTTLSIKVKFVTTAGNDLQGDEADLTLRFLLAQVEATDLAA